MMRRSQSVRNQPRPSLALISDDLGVLREGDESNEDVLRKQLIEKDRECDRLQTQVQQLQAQLAQRPSLESVQELQKEHKNLELLLQGTQRENERCMADIERGKTREKMLERELARLAGDNWQVSLDIAPSPAAFQPHATLSGHRHSLPSAASDASGDINNAALLARLDQIRLTVLGMEQRALQREEKLNKNIQVAEAEARKYEDISKSLTA
ncbi:uncharacterized protein EV420DRAFT_1302529 [Desarmillaria tabescens]|uniref:Uncharacterized protein n=1 Tax=Armillaria tabescens TaxID=1929756 RepID=A0AA39TV06_ARMTA|nr:uncharacterized protein EV420DRAFT_1302529 [Desarmillaria tabescens]KAK0464264.1 hypothetical protein EV420DRAFT_1302529 [Desarmillaria tabescens]